MIQMSVDNILKTIEKEDIESEEDIELAEWW
jgi:hypothetical protein